MRKIIGILVCLWISVGLWAVDFQPAAFGSTSAYLHEGRGAGIASQSAMRPSGTLAYGSGVSKGGSMAAISASNFETLNSEGGACYNPARDGATIKRGRPGGAIGEYDFHSPVGATPWLLMLLLAGGYILLKRKRLSASK